MTLQHHQWYSLSADLTITNRVNIFCGHINHSIYRMTNFSLRFTSRDQQVQKEEREIWYRFEVQSLCVSIHRWVCVTLSRYFQSTNQHSFFLVNKKKIHKEKLVAKTLAIRQDFYLTWIFFSFARSSRSLFVWCHWKEMLMRDISSNISKNDETICTNVCVWVWWMDETSCTKTMC